MIGYTRILGDGVGYATPSFILRFTRFQQFATAVLVSYEAQFWLLAHA